MPSIKVHGGTPQGSKSICLTCTNAFVAHTGNLQTVVRCRSLVDDPTVPQPVVQCSHYEDKRIPSKYDMEKIAWVIETRNRGAAGFSGAEREVQIRPPKKRDDD
jgi:hypothetical protein